MYGIYEILLKFVKLLTEMNIRISESYFVNEMSIRNNLDVISVTIFKTTFIDEIWVVSNILEVKCT